MTAASQKRSLGMVTIGRAPRDDVMPQMVPFLPGDLDIRQAGALDGLTREQIALLAPGPNDYVLHTRLRDGSAVTVGREQVLELVQACIDQLENEGASPILLLCTGEFPNLRSNVLLVEPDRLLVSVAGGLGPRRVGVFVPLRSQTEPLTRKWRTLDAETAFTTASPYASDHDEISRAADKLRRQRVDLVVMDCIGYTQIHRRLVRQVTRAPVILASSILARIASELIA